MRFLLENLICPQSCVLSFSGESDLRGCLDSLLSEQGRLCRSASASTLFSSRLRKRLLILKRHILELKRAQNQPPPTPTTLDQPVSETSDSMPSPIIHPPAPVSSSSSALNRLTRRSAETPGEGLARLGSRAALSFAFAFLRRAWRSGEDADLCTDLLQDSLDALLTLPEASMFDPTAISEVWWEVVGRTTRFLRSVVLSEISCDPAHPIPMVDKHTSLALLLEFAVQKGEFQMVLRCIITVDDAADDCRNTSYDAGCGDAADQDLAQRSMSY